MGNHYVPQHYLTGFADPASPKSIWQFDKQTDEFCQSPLSIKKVAQQRNFYDAETEEQLARLVERPGNAVLDKLRSGDFDLSDQDRVDLSVYMATMLKRVPRSRLAGYEIAPQSLAKVTTELREKIRSAEDVGLLSAERAEKYVEEAEAAAAKFADELPQNVVDILESPWPSQQMIQLIYDMHWRFAVAKNSRYFLTSDNPAFFFTCWGLANPSGQSEVTFPISEKLALFGSWTPIRRPADRIVKHPEFVKEANRRIASGATRFIFAPCRSTWVAKVAHKKPEQLNRIEW